MTSIDHAIKAAQSPLVSSQNRAMVKHAITLAVEYGHLIPADSIEGRLAEAEAILNDLANDYPVSWNAAALNFCTLCSVMALPCDGKGSFPESHAESCSWRRAVEWKAKQPMTPISQCERCLNTAPGLRTRQDEPMAPDGWLPIDGRLLCPECMYAFDEWWENKQPGP